MIVAVKRALLGLVLCVAVCGCPASQPAVDTAAQQAAVGDFSLALQKCNADADGSLANAESCWASVEQKFCGDGGSLAGHCGDGGAP